MLGRVELLKKSIIEEAEERARKIIENAEKEAEKIIKEYREKAQREAQDMRDKAIIQIEMEASEILDRGIRRAREIRHNKIKKITEEIFERAWKEILEEYESRSREILLDLLEVGVEYVSEEPLIIEARDEIFEKVGKNNIIQLCERKGKKVVLRNGEVSTGFRVLSNDEKIWIESTLEGRFEECKRRLIPVIVKRLTGRRGETRV